MIYHRYFQSIILNVNKLTASYDDILLLYRFFVLVNNKYAGIVLLYAVLMLRFKQIHLISYILICNFVFNPRSNWTRN